jgi:hypothetical protein
LTLRAALAIAAREHRRGRGMISCDQQRSQGGDFRLHSGAGSVLSLHHARQEPFEPERR